MKTMSHIKHLHQQQQQAIKDMAESLHQGIDNYLEEFGDVIEGEVTTGEVFAQVAFEFGLLSLSKESGE